MPVRVLVFGNPLVEEDSIALRLMPMLQKRFPEIEFRECDSAESIENEGRDLIILDAAKGVGRVALIDDISAIETGKIYSMHDFDLALTLKLLRKMRAIDSVRIIAVPSDYPLGKALEEASGIISSSL